MLRVTVLLLQIKSIPQVEAAFEYLATVGGSALDVEEFEKKAGVGEFFQSLMPVAFLFD
jgi:hypothetical protein